ncbi:DUF808 domain-containing protein [Nocardioides daphniae]|uniref:ABC transporter n=1 Tax=Nocardioides daphniae TaxID=402297 RepID=A0A4P7UE87_9ACTN|nr:DUF808 domain-containing protein [Nocardioides daphniae]QCC77841.1 DUF808 domain-containing protein [Nocardioides daphniae]GGD27808.1 ABC transporter [Nocardioides daphniae]
MSGGFFALLDDVATLVKVASASIDDVGAAAGRASAKAAGVVIDDTAVTPQYVQGLAAKRELPIVKQIAKGSLVNKLCFILPAALLLSQFLPWLLTPILMLGGTFLAFEGAEKIYEKFFGHSEPEVLATEIGPEQEKKMVSGAIRTDLILSAEIMVIALNEVTDEPFLSRAMILVVVAIGITLLVYGIVGLIVKADDFGLMLATKARSGFGRGFGRRLVKSMPGVLATIGAVGTVAMLWVGGHILLVGLDDLGWHAPYELVHHLEVAAHDAVPVAAGAVGWLVNTACSAVFGLVVGAVVVLVLHLLPFGHGKDEEHAEAAARGKAHRSQDLAAAGGSEGGTPGADTPGPSH